MITDLVEIKTDKFSAVVPSMMTVIDRLRLIDDSEEWSAWFHEALYILRELLAEDKQEEFDALQLTEGLAVLKVWLMKGNGFKPAKRVKEI